MGRRAHVDNSGLELWGCLSAALFFAFLRRFARHAKPPFLRIPDALLMPIDEVMHIA